MKAFADQHPNWKDKQPFKAVLENDMKALAESGMEGIGQLLMARHAGMSTEAFEKIATNWIATARHPKTDKPYTQMVFQPMLELPQFLRV